MLVVLHSANITHIVWILHGHLRLRNGEVRALSSAVFEECLTYLHLEAIFLTIYELLDVLEEFHANSTLFSAEHSSKVLEEGNLIVVLPELKHRFIVVIAFVFDEVAHVEALVFLIDDDLRPVLLTSRISTLEPHSIIKKPENKFAFWRWNEEPSNGEELLFQRFDGDIWILQRINFFDHSLVLITTHELIFESRTRNINSLSMWIMYIDFPIPYSTVSKK